MTKFSHVFTPLLICCYAIIAVLAIYQIYLMKRHLYNLLSFNTGFLCCCVPWCLLRISYWLVPGDSCASDTNQLLQGFMLELPINLEFVCFYLIMVYIMRQVRNSEGTWDREFKTWLKWISLAAHTIFLGCNVATVILQVTAGSRKSGKQWVPADDADCYTSNITNPQQCAKYGCFEANETASDLQLGFSSCAFLILALSLLFYGTKLHINAREAKNPRPVANRSIADPTESIPQIAFGAGESPVVTETICVILLLVFVSRSVFDALQLDMFAAAPLSIPQDKDITNFWIFFVYMGWEILPIALMLFFFGSTKHAPKHTRSRIKDYGQPMREDEAEDPLADSQRLAAAAAPAPNTYWPMSNPQTGASFTGEAPQATERAYSPARYHGGRKENVSFMENENRYDSQPGTPQQQPMNGPSVREGTMLQAGALAQGRMADRAFLFHASQTGHG